jgi:hypothetical protein
MVKKPHDTCGLYYKHTTIVNYATSIINKIEALLTDDARVIIYDRHVFIVQATAHRMSKPTSSKQTSPRSLGG